MPSDIFMSQGQTALFTTAAVCMITHPTQPGLYISKMSVEIIVKGMFFIFFFWMAAVPKEKKNIAQRLFF